MAEQGEPIVGVVTERGTTRGKNQTIYWVRHRFTSPAHAWPADESITSWHNVPFGIWQKLYQGMQITILFDPANVRRHLPLYAFRYVYIREDQGVDEATA